MKCCAVCGTKWPLREAPGFNAVCEKCQGYLHSCVNCALFDRNSGLCKSPSTEDVRNREGKNWCDEFQFGATPPEESKKKSEEAKKRLEKLFGK